MTAPEDRSEETAADIELPRGFTAHVANVGIKDATDDFVVISTEVPCAAAAVFTRSRFAGPSVELSRRHVADGSLRAVVVVSKNANVATGEAGRADAEELAAGVAGAIGADPSDVLVASTGVIGRRYPMDRVRSHLARLATPFPITSALPVATAMMTTDTHPKVAARTVPTRSDGVGGPARVVGVAKGVGMIEPDMATMLAFVFTDAEVAPDVLDAADFVALGPPTLAATITPQHLLYTVGHMLQGFKYHLYCLPLLKYEDDRAALRAAVISDKNTKFFAGTDSAPHVQKVTPCGCAAGCYTGGIAPQLYAQAFERAGAEVSDSAFKNFLCLNGPAFYGLPVPVETFKMQNKSVEICIENFPAGSVVPLPAGLENTGKAELYWSLV